MRIRDAKKLIEKLENELSYYRKLDCDRKNYTAKVLERDEYRCVLCNDIDDLKVHHLKPRSLGGSNNIPNLITVCHYCHWYLHMNPKSSYNHVLLIKQGIAKAKSEGRITTRPRKYDYEKIIEYWKECRNINETSRKLGITKGSVYNAIKSFKGKLSNSSISPKKSKTVLSTIYNENA